LKEVLKVKEKYNLKRRWGGGATLSKEKGEGVGNPQSAGRKNQEKDEISRRKKSLLM